MSNNPSEVEVIGVVETKGDPEPVTVVVPPQIIEVAHQGATMPVADLLRGKAGYNPRQISPEDFESLKRSMVKFGAVEPVVFNRRLGRLVGGHQRVDAAAALGWTTLPVFFVDLDEPDEIALNVALNRIHGDWKMDSLAGLVARLDDERRILAGFSEREFTALREDGHLYEVRIADARAEGKEFVAAHPRNMEPSIDDVPAPPAAATSRPGDIWVLGNHRLMCGNSASPADLDILLAGAPIHLVNTDPPYNVKVEPRSNNAIAAGLSSFTTTHHQKLDVERHPGKSKPTQKRLRAKDRPLANDFVGDQEFSDLLDGWFGNIARVLVPGRAFYCWGGYSNVSNYPGAFIRAGLYFSQAIIWVKGHPVLTRKDFMGDHEWCFYGWKEGAAHEFFGPNNVSDVWPVKKVNPQSMVHLTEKPVELAVRAILYSSRTGENVLDLFGGSGSTLMACEQAQRHAFLMEIDPLYCDVILTRWSNHTGKAPVLDGSGATFAAVAAERGVVMEPVKQA